MFFVGGLFLLALLYSNSQKIYRQEKSDPTFETANKDEDSWYYCDLVAIFCLYLFR
jgi:hypothetical protein